MTYKIKNLLIKYREIIVYGIFGVLTTLVDFGIYWVFTRLLYMDETLSQGISIAAAIIFAYIVNKIFVFRDNIKNPLFVLRQFITFSSMRVISGLFQTFCVWLFVEQLYFYDMAVKAIIAVFVIVVNYLFSKLLIFRSGK